MPIGNAIGDFGSQVGEASLINQDYAAKKQEMQMQAARQKIQELLAPLQLQQLQGEIAKMNRPKQELVGTPGGGTDYLEIGPNGPSAPKHVIAGKAPSAKERFENETDPEKKKQYLDDIKSEAEAIGSGKVDPLKKLQKEASDAFDSGDMDTYRAKLKEIQEFSSAKKAPTAPTTLGLILRANAGDPEALAAIQTKQRMDAATAEARGMGFGKGRAAYTVGAYYNDNGELVPMSALDAVNRIHAGETLTPAGRLSPKDAIAFQQFNSEAAPAIAAVKANAKAFDNSADRAIYAKVMHDAGPASYGNESTWLRNIINQAAASGLSPEGRQEALAVSRLNETVGRMRSILGLPSTDTAMQLTLSLVPGPATPDSKYALSQIDMLEQMANLATNIPAMRNVSGATTPGGTSSVKPTSNTPPPGAKVRDYTQLGPN